MKKIILFSSFVALCLGAQFSSAVTIPLAPLKDNTLIEAAGASPQLSNGKGDMFVGRTAQPVGTSIRRGLIQFDIAGAIPAGSIINSVKLTLRDVMGNNGNQDVTLHRVLQNWGEGSSNFNGGVGAPAQDQDATWLYTFYDFANPSASPKWVTPGGDFDPNPSALTQVTGPAGGQLFDWTSPTMAADVQGWLDTSSSNHGWLLKQNESAGMTAKRLNSRESNTSPNVAPVLLISYTVPEPRLMGLVILSAAGLVVVVRAPRRED